MDAVAHLAPTVGVVAACDFLAVARASFYRQRPVLGPSASPAPEPALPSERLAPARSLSEAERAAVLGVLHEERFQDRSPAAVQATLLDEGQYLCSIRTMYRILQQEGESGERRDQLIHPATPRRLYAGLTLQIHHLPPKVLDLTGTLTPADQGGKPLHVGQRPSYCTKASVASIPLKLRFSNQVEATSITKSAELELWNEHRHY